MRIGGEAGERKLLDLYAGMGRALARFQRLARRRASSPTRASSRRSATPPTMTKPATNAELPGAFLVYQF